MKLYSTLNMTLNVIYFDNNLLSKFSLHILCFRLFDLLFSLRWDCVVSLQDNSSAIVDHIFSSNALVNPAIPVYHLRDLIKR